MKRTNPETKPYLSWCLIVRNCEKTLPGGLEACLRSLRKRTPDAEISIVDTCSSDDGLLRIQLAPTVSVEDVKLTLISSGCVILPPYLDDTSKVVVDVIERETSFEAIVDELREALGEKAISIERHPGTVEIASAFADKFEIWKGPEGTWTKEMLAFDNAAAARQRSFENASGTWRGWIDADDVIPDPDVVLDLLERNGRRAKELQGQRTHPDIAEGKRDAVMTLEDILNQVEKYAPQIDCIYAPYAYQRNPHDPKLFIKWHERERIVKWENGWKWSEAAHEVLVPINKNTQGRILPMTALLFVHNKRWTAQDDQFSLQRHYAIFAKQYDAGDRSNRTLRYLFNYAAFVCPEMRETLADEMKKHALSRDDLYWHHCAKAEMAAQAGIYWDVQEHVAAAIAMNPLRSHAYALGAEVANNVKDYTESVRLYRLALNAQPDLTNTAPDPREHDILLPLRAVLVMSDLAKNQSHTGNSAGAIETLTEAVQIINRVLVNPAAQSDLLQVNFVAIKLTNELDAEKSAVKLNEICDFLRLNDEPLKIRAILKCFPYMLEDHPVMVKWEKFVAPYGRNYSEVEAKSHYNQLTEKDGAIPTETFNQKWLTLEGAVPRVRDLVDWIQKNKPDARILEVGSYDGITAIPVLRTCLNVKYVAFDFMQTALQRLNNYACALVPDGNARLETTTNKHNLCGVFDIIVFHEVIEHMAQPQMEVGHYIHKLLAKDGRVFFSTPNGAFDKGSPLMNPAVENGRDIKGHVRAYTVNEFFKLAESCGLAVDHCRIVEGLNGHGYGDTIHGQCIKSTPPIWAKKRIAFVVPSALWDWNGSGVYATGIGMSEEAIVYLAEYLAKRDFDVTVYGPVPHEECWNGVKYLKLAKVRHLDPHVVTVVSRAPQYAAYLDEITGGIINKILWLQDAEYPDMTLANSKKYKSIVVLTNWHKELMVASGAEEAKVSIINNFLLKEHFDFSRQIIQRVPHGFIYSSSPDRGLLDLLLMWPKVLARFRNATLNIFYGWEGFAVLGAIRHGTAYRNCRLAFEKLRLQQGVREHGRINHVALAQAMRQSAIWAYPTRFGETGCATAFKVQAAGCAPVATRYAGLAETGDLGYTQWIDEMPAVNDPHYVSRFLDACEQAISMPDATRQEMAQKAIATYDREVIGEKWLHLIRQIIE